MLRRVKLLMRFTNVLTWELNRYGRQTTDNGRRTTDDGRWTTDDERRTTDDGQRTTDDGRRTTDDGQRTTDDGRRTTDDRRHTLNLGVDYMSSKFDCIIYKLYIFLYMCFLISPYVRLRVPAYLGTRGPIEHCFFCC